MKSPRKYQTLLFATALATCTIVGTAHSAPVELKFGTIIPGFHPINKRVIEPWLRAVEKDSGGTVRIRLFAGGALVRHPGKQVEMVRNRVAEMGMLIGAYTPNLFPDEAIVGLPLGISDVRTASLLVSRLHQAGLLRGYRQTKVLGLFATGPNYISADRPIKKMADLRGLKFRAAGATNTAVVRSLGGTPMFIHAPQLAEAISRGVADGLIMSYTAMMAYRIDKVTSHHIEYPLGFTALHIGMNKDVWDSLPAKAKAAFERHSGEKLTLALAAMDDGMRAGIRKKLAASGKHTFVSLSKEEQTQWKAALAPVIAAWKKRNDQSDKLFAAMEKILSDIKAGR